MKQEITEKEMEAINQIVDSFRERLMSNHIMLQRVALENGSQPLKLQSMAENIADYFVLEHDKIMSKATRKREYTIARCILVWFARQDGSGFNFSLARLGELMGGFDHATMINSLKRFEEEFLYNRAFRKDVNNILRNIGWKVCDKNGKPILQLIS